MAVEFEEQSYFSGTKGVKKNNSNLVALMMKTKLVKTNRQASLVLTVLFLMIIGVSAFMLLRYGFRLGQNDQTPPIRKVYTPENAPQDLKARLPSGN